MDDIEVRFTARAVAQILEAMSERIKATEAVRRTGVPSDIIFLAIRHGDITGRAAVAGGCRNVAAACSGFE
ncbi:MAG: hypothetical protein ACRD2W_15155 [Acidimicrobiales bacterium]